MTPVASLIIPSWNGERFIAACLRSLCSSTDSPIEIIVVDNGSQDHTTALAQNFAEVKLIANADNLGFAHAINQGLHAATGEVLVLLNQDIVAHPGWLEAVLQRLQRQPSAGIVGCKLLYPDGSVQHAGGYLAQPMCEGRHYRDDAESNSIDFVTGAAFAIRRACWQAIGDFDERFYPVYFEDVDFCLRAKQAGFGVVYEKNAVLTHYESQSRGDNFGHAVTFHAQRFRFVLKHQSFDTIAEKFLPYERKRVQQAMPHDVTTCYALAHVGLYHALHLAEWAARFDSSQRLHLADALLSLRQFSLAQVTG
jgi:GT2 family glycosyltransferase